jgi:hypothetical protein
MSQGNDCVFVKQSYQLFFLPLLRQGALGTVFAGMFWASSGRRSERESQQPMNRKTAGFQNGKSGRFSRHH